VSAGSMKTQERTRANAFILESLGLGEAAVAIATPFSGSPQTLSPSTAQAANRVEIGSGLLYLSQAGLRGVEGCPAGALPGSPIPDSHFGNSAPPVSKHLPPPCQPLATRSEFTSKLDPVRWGHNPIKRVQFLLDRPLRPHSGRDSDPAGPGCPPKPV